MENQINRYLELQYRNTILSQFLLPNNIILCVYALIGVTGNLYVIFIYSFRMKSSKDDRYFIPYLAIADLFACIFGTTFALSLNFLPLSFYGNILCKTMWFLCQATTTCSCQLLLVIALHRYKKVVTPFYHQMTKQWKRICLVVCCVSSLLVSSPAWLYYGEITIKNNNATGARCGPLQDDPNVAFALMLNNIIMTVFLGVGVVALSVMYGLIGRTIYLQYRKHRRKPKKLGEKTKNELKCSVSQSISSASIGTCTPSPTENLPGNSLLLAPETDSHLVVHWMRQFRRSSYEAVRNSVTSVWNHLRAHRYSYMFITVTVIFVISYLPRIALMVLESLYIEFWDTLTDNEIRICLFLYRMYLINHVTNPVVYGYFDTRFKKVTKELLCTCLKRK